MKNSVKKYMKWITLLAAVVMMGACNKWTDPQSLEIERNDLESVNPELYARYLAALREYKTNDHKVMIGYVDNVEVPFSRGSHLTDMPDSLDAVVLKNADRLPEWIIAQKNEIREKKNTICLYEISYTAIEKEWKLIQEAKAEADQNKPEVTAEAEGGEGEGEGDGEEPAPEQTFVEFIALRVDSLLQICPRYNYDGFIVEYLGKNPASMQEEPKAQYTAEQEAFLTPIFEWYSLNDSKSIVFEGNPQNLIDNSCLSECDFIILPSVNAASGEALSFMMIEASVAGVPTDRYIAKVQTLSFDADDLVTGYYGTERALLKATSWVAMPQPGYEKCGLAVYNIQNDYFNLKLIYQYSREAINIMNPSPKN